MPHNKLVKKLTIKVLFKIETIEQGSRYIVRITQPLLKRKQAKKYGNNKRVKTS